MKKYHLLLCLIILSAIAQSQSKINTALNKKLQQMFAEDQKWRIENNKQDSKYTAAEIEKNWAEADARNMAEAKKILARYGYPGYSLVGESGSSKFWAIVQHCDDDIAFQQKVLALMDKEVKRDNASANDFAYLKDRVLVNSGKKQLYGTQGRRDMKTKVWKPFPISDSVNVDARRKKAGMEPLADLVKMMNNLK